MSLKNRLAVWFSYLLYRVGRFFEAVWDKYEWSWAWELYVRFYRASAEIDYTFKLGIWEDTIDAIDLSGIKDPDFYKGL